MPDVPKIALEEVTDFDIAPEGDEHDCSGEDDAVSQETLDAELLAATVEPEVAS